MPQSRLNLITTLEGVGSLLLEGHEKPIKYTIRIFQEMREVAPGREVPGLKSAAGQLSGLSPQDASKAMGQAVGLTLSDGQKSDVIVTDPTGAFQVIGAIQ